jgi:Flp pilus assembly protein TadG
LLAGRQVALAGRQAASRRTRGQTMVEMAMVFPLLILVAMALVQFALYFHARSVVEAAVQEGARVAAAEAGSVGRGEDRAYAVLRAGLGRDVGVEVRIRTPNPDVVVADADGSMRSFIPWFSFDRGVGALRLPLEATARMTREHFREDR